MKVAAVAVLLVLAGGCGGSDDETDAAEAFERAEITEAGADLEFPDASEIKISVRGSDGACFAVDEREFFFEKTTKAYAGPNDTEYDVHRYDLSLTVSPTDC